MLASSLADPLASQQAADAARYALLRRLAPAMRHNLVVHLQPIGIVYEVMQRRLKMPEPDLASVLESAQKINGFARSALASCLDVVSWLAPEEGAVATVAEGARECASLLATNLSFRGYTLRNEVGEVQGQVRRPAMRMLLSAALVHAGDEWAAPMELRLTAQAESRGARVQLHGTPAEGEAAPHPVPYRKLAWDDLEALAHSEDVELTREGTQGIGLLLPWA